MSAELKVAIVGCGVIGLNHVRAIERVSNFAVTALVDPDEDAPANLVNAVQELNPLSRIGEVAQFRTLEEALAAGIDMVAICTPSGLHVAQAEQALNAGVHVVIEKPLDVDLARGRRIATAATAAAKRGILTTVISQHRFDPAAVAVAEAVNSGEFGRMTSAVASVSWWRSQAYYDSGAWRGTWELDGGGALMNQGVHTVDLLVWFLGRPVEVAAHTACLAHERIEVEDVVTATVKFESGALAVIHATTAAYPGLSARIQLHGTRGSAVLDNDRLVYFGSAAPSDDDSGQGIRDISAERVPVGHDADSAPGPESFIEGHVRQYLDIAEAVRDGRAPGVTVDDALLALALVRSVYVSAALGSPVSVDEVLAGDFDHVEVANR
jgi:UDP-N-acetyl-2-amino-2-deoxyglucuronate dehydrogenase